MFLIFAFVFAVARVGVDHFVLKNASVQLTIIEGRITSLYDVALKYVLFQIDKHIHRLRDHVFFSTPFENRHTFHELFSQHKAVRLV